LSGKRLGDSLRLGPKCMACHVPAHTGNDAPAREQGDQRAGGVPAPHRFHHDLFVISNQPCENREFDDPRTPRSTGAGRERSARQGHELLCPGTRRDRLLARPGWAAWNESHESRLRKPSDDSSVHSPRRASASLIDRRSAGSMNEPARGFLAAMPFKEHGGGPGSSNDRR